MVNNANGKGKELLLLFYHCIVNWITMYLFTINKCSVNVYAYDIFAAVNESFIFTMHAVTFTYTFAPV